ncbi:energy-coupling factor ABC transporter ATP-binding protein [Oceanobacillus jeddahense]|uniref:energy-coupling factor ABC transporter ATP-binding protein n=1 Tax=Oceanobacillus jeddahense TaxID=1462527 RepID=UPI000AF0260C|nr:ABC transporter ATP-binding protein [Oceanobacillus jeddahense]
MMSYISVRNLSYQYPIGNENVLKNINLDLEQGKLYALIGSNGSGKTTLCNVLRGYIPHFYKGELQGHVNIKEKDIREWEMGEIAKHIGYVFQNPFTQISGVKDTVFEEIAYGLENLGIEVDAIKKSVENVIQMLDIDYLRDKNPNDLSGGQKQRVAFASIIVMNPDILIIDEPTSQLDPDGTEEIFRIIDLMKRQGKTIILVEHKMELIAKYADEVILMQNGEVKMKGKKEDILSDKEVLQFDSTLPQYALLGLELRKKGVYLDSLPITEEDALEIITKLLERKEVCI